MEELFDHPQLYSSALRLAPLANLIPEGLTHIRTLNPWGVAHAMPNFAKESFQTMWKKGKLKKQ